jgi:hypothetical protein
MKLEQTTMKLEQGDAFEITHADWIRRRLPMYETVWQEFIGHNGRGQPLPIVGLTSDQNSRRAKFYQAHYSAARGCFRVDEELGKLEAGLGEVRDVQSLMQVQHTFFDFMSCIGYVRDQFLAIEGALGLNGELYGPLQSYYEQRSQVTHGPQLPFNIEGSLMRIPRLAHENKSSNEWDSKSLWLDFEAQKFVYIADFCRETGESFFNLVNSLHPKIYSAAHDAFGGRKIQDNGIEPVSRDSRHGLSWPSMILPVGSGEMSSIVVSGWSAPKNESGGDTRTSGV